MSKRFTCTDKWEDVWFSDLEPDMKLAWIYILDRCNHAGIWKRNFRNLCFHCHSTKSPVEITAIFKDKKIVEFGNDKWFVPKFLKFQYPSGLNSNKPAIISVRNKLIEEELLSVVHEWLGNDYLIINESLNNDKPMIAKLLKTKTRLKTKINLIDKDKDKEESMYSVEFEKFWNLYPPRHGKKLEKNEAFKKFKLLKKLELEQIIQAVKNYADDDDVKKGIGIRDPKRFLKNDFWREFINKPVKEKNWLEKIIEKGEQAQNV